MGTNYYGKKMPETKDIDNVILKIRNNELEDAKTILEQLINKTTIHIGKASSGWKFVFDANEKTFYTFEEYKEYLKEYVITSEYGKIISHNEFWELVEKKQILSSAKNDNYCLLDGYEFFLSTNFC